MTQLAAPDAVRHTRCTHLKSYLARTDFTPHMLASMVELPVGSIFDFMAGRVPITDELAMHIEEMLALPPCWLDVGGEMLRRTEHLQSVSSASHFSVEGVNAMAEKSPQPRVPEQDTVPGQAALPGQPERRGIMVRRQSNLVMLTTQRGTKNVLAHLAGTTGSRISLMTSGRKPVSDPFAHAIEDGLKLPRGWLDATQDVPSVPHSVWSQLGASEMVSAGGTSSGAGPAGPASAQARQPRLAAKEERQSAVAVLDSPAPASSPAAYLAPTGHGRANEGILFSKSPGQTGPIAEALAKTVLQLSAADKLTERKAFQILGLMLEDLER